MPYDPALVQPMRDELTAIGVQELTSAAAVDEWMSGSSGTALVIVNSVCGCAAGGARPAIGIALSQTPRPDRVATVFAGQDVEATAAMRAHFADYPPSSPCFALFRDGEVVHFVPRHAIEGRDPHGIAWDLAQAFEKHCAPVER